MQRRSTAILTGPDVYLDHIGVLCYLMDIPLLITEEDTYQASLLFYPQVRAIKKEMGELSLSYLASQFDVIFESGKYWATELAPLLHLLHKQQVRFVYCPHGNSDKGYLAKNHQEQDISLFYGQHMLDLLTRNGAINHIYSLVRTGNYRLLFYQKYKDFYKNLVQEHVVDKLLPARKTILYAPTWQDGESPSSFFQETGRIVEQLQKDFNVVVKLHPFLEALQPAHTYRIVSLYEHVKGVVFLHRYPAIYSLLDICDLYIGDYSSIGYDFLSFDKPLYFFGGEEQCSKNTLLHSCGLLIPSHGDISQFIQNTWEENQESKKEKRKEVYNYAFGEDKPFEVLREEIEKTISTNKKPALIRRV